MPTFSFTSPEGKTYDIEGPEGSTKEQAFEVLQGQLKSEPKAKEVAPRDPKSEARPKGTGDRLADILMSPVKGAVGLADTALAMGAGAVMQGLGGAAGAVNTLGKGLGYGAAALMQGAPVGEAMDAAAQAGADTVNTVQSKAYQPKSDVGQATSQTISKPFEMASSGLGQLGHAAGSVVGPKTAAALETVGENLVPAIGAVAGVESLASGLKGARAMTPKLTQSEDAIARARKNGYMANPMDSSGGAVNDVLGTVANAPVLDQTLAKKNSKVTTSLAKKAVGIADDQFLNEDSIKLIKERADQAYSAIQNLKDINLAPDSQLASDLHMADKPTQHAARAKEAAPEYYRTPTFERIKTEILNPQATHTPGSLMLQIADLRADATKLYKRVGAKPEELREAGAMKAVAQSLEDFLERRVTESVYTGGEAAAAAPAGLPLPTPARPALPGPQGQPPIGQMPPKFGGVLNEQSNAGRQQLIDNWRAAREQRAKIHNVEDAANLQTGHVDPAVLKSMKDSGVRLTGPLADIVQAHEAMGHVVRGIEGSTMNTGLRASDQSVGSSLLHAAAEPLLLPFAVRKVMAGKLYQKYMANPTVSSLQQLKELDPAMAAKATAAISAANPAPNRNELPPKIELRGMAQ